MALLFIVFCLYLLLFNPAFTFAGGLHSSLFMWPLLVLLINKKYRRGLQRHKGLFVTWTLLFIYIFLRTLSGGIPAYLIGHIVILIETIFISFLLIKISLFFKVDLEKALLLVASVASVISCWCLINPSVNEYIKGIQVITNDYLLRFSFRGFGLGEGLTFTYAVILGSICALGICKIKKYKWFIVFIPIVSIAVLINARTGFIPIGISFIFFMLTENKLSYYLYVLVAIGILGVLWVLILEDWVPSDTLEWSLMFFEEIGDGTEGDTVQVLLNTTAWPDDASEWIFGKGFSVFEPIRGKRTDVGYLIQLCYGGIIYCVLLYLMVWTLVKTAYKNMPKTYFWTLILSMFLENYKGEFISKNMAFTFFSLIMIYYTQLDSSDCRKSCSVKLGQ